MWFNPIMRGLLRSPLHFFASKNTMLMTYTGRKSGKVYTTPMNYLSMEGDLCTISSRERVWWRNLRGGAQVTVHLQGRDVQARAKCIEDEEQVEAELLVYFRTVPQLARYMNVGIDADGIPNCKDLRRLAREKVIVTTVLK